MACDGAVRVNTVDASWAVALIPAVSEETVPSAHGIKLQSQVGVATVMVKEIETEFW